MFREVAICKPIYLSHARGRFGFTSKCYMAFLAYFDASGSGVDPAGKVLSAGGFVAHEDVWATFEKRWPAILDRFSVNALHMKDYAHSRGEFLGWEKDPKKRQAFMVEVTGEINEHDLRFFGGTVALSVHRAFSRHYCIEEALGVPYTVAILTAMSKLGEWQRRNSIKEPILVFIEKGDNQQSDLRRYFARVAWDDLMPEPTFLDKKRTDGYGRVHYVYPFQLADFITYEQGKALSDALSRNKRQVRKSLRTVSRPIEEPVEGRTFWTVLERRTFSNFIENFRIPRRFNHFSGGHVGRKRTYIQPLGYIGDQPLVGYFGNDGFIEDLDRH